MQKKVIHVVLQKENIHVLLQAPLQKYAAALKDKAAQRHAMQASSEVQVSRKASLIDGASDSDEEDEGPMKQSQQQDAQQADEVGFSPSLSSLWLDTKHLTMSDLLLHCLLSLWMI